MQNELEMEAFNLRFVKLLLSLAGKETLMIVGANQDDRDIHMRESKRMCKYEGIH